jgi:hypothetical protein
MKVGEIIEMTKEKTIAIIARDHLKFGEKKLRETLKNIGGYHESGRKGWSFKGDSKILEKSIYDFVQINKKTNEQKPRATNEQTNKETNEYLKKISDAKKNESVKKRASFDIDVQSLKKIKIYAVEVDQKISDVVDEALFDFINKKGL